MISANRARDPAWNAALCAAALLAHQFAGKATRDALFLSSFDVTVLPTLVLAGAVASLLVVAAVSRAMSVYGPSRLVPAAFAASAGMQLGLWWLASWAPRVTAIACYLHVSVLGLALISGFWSVVSERFDPRTVKRVIGRIAAAGTLGGIAGGVLAARVASVWGVGAMFPVLALLHLSCAWAVRRIQPPQAASADAGARNARARRVGVAGGLGLLMRTPYLRNLSLMVVIAAVAAALLDYVFKAHAAARLLGAEELLRFFAVYYTGVGILTFLAQALLNRRSLERLGLGGTVAALPGATAALGLGAWLAPGLAGVLAARSAEAVLRHSLFRAGYELLYTPLPAREKRAVKPLVDVGFERLGDALGGALVKAVLLLAPLGATSLLLALAVCLSLVSLLLAVPLHRGYVASLARSLRERATELDLEDVADSTTRSVILRTRGGFQVAELLRSPTPPAKGGREGAAAGAAVVGQVAALLSDEPVRIREVLAAGPLSAPLIPYVLPLLAREELRREALLALRHAASLATGQLVDALLDPAQPLAVRRDMARTLSAVPSQRSIEGLLAGLDDPRFDVRWQCGQALARIHRGRPELRVDRQRVEESVLREVRAGARLWETAQALESDPEGDDSPFLDGFLRQRSSRGLEHVFTLLSLALPEEPLRIAFRGLHTDDEQLRGTALEYLDGALPQAIREPLWRFIGDGRPAVQRARPKEEVLAALLRSSESVQIKLEELRGKPGPKA